jgi:hypothetical protein
VTRVRKPIAKGEFNENLDVSEQLRIMPARGLQPASASASTQALNDLYPLSWP